MSWFEYGTPKKRSLRKGVWLRVRDLPSDIWHLTKKFIKPDDSINWVVVQEIKSDNKVLLEFWCKEFLEKRERYIVFHLLVPENSKWICEGDLGRGYKA